MIEREKVTIDAKTLDDNQMENILPGHKNIYKQIDNMRSYAKECKNGKGSINRIYNSGCNVFSILGKRGAGKSSILLTLRKKIKEEKDINIALPIILPIILPDTIGKKSDMMGWILGTFEKEVDKLSKIQIDLQRKEENNEDNFGKCRLDKKSTLINKKYNEVLKQYRYTREEYADILKDNYSGFKEYIDETKKILDPENKLKSSFFQFIDEVVNVKVKESNNDKEPMIFIFLDDIDLTKNHCQEILGVIARYLCHPNIIIFISGDYDIFEIEQFMSYIKASQLMGLVVAPREGNALGRKLLDDNMALASDALKKIMPPAYRYKLNSLSNKKRLKFYYEDNSKKTIKGLLEEKFSQLYDDKEQGHKKSLNVINAYGLIFDDMPRGIMNVYYVLNSIESNEVLKDQMKDSGDEKLSEEEKKKKKEAVNIYLSEFKILLDTIIRSSSILSKYEDEINRCIQINNPFSKTFFNHERLMKEIEKNSTKYNFIENSCKENNDKDVSDKAEKHKDEIKHELNHELNHEMIVVLIFAHFIESTVQLVNKNRKIHGKDQLLKLLDANETQKDKFKIYPGIDKTNIIFDLYESMLSNDALNIMPTMDDIYLKDFSVKFYFEQLEDIYEFKKENIGKIIDHISMQDLEWTIEKFKIIYYHKNPLCMIFNKAINVIVNKLKVNDNANDAEKIYKEKIQNEFKKEIYDELILYEKVEINVEDKSYKEKFEVNLRKKLKNKLAEITELGKFEEIKDKEELDKLGKAIDNYFSKEKIESVKSDNTDQNDNTIEENKKDEYYKIVNIAILYTALKEMSEVGEYEQDYFKYFQEWHNELKDKEPYKSWCDKQIQSPLTLILENSKNV